eukprot:jgi/Ulvmu1/9414/UM051_0042.1
MPKNVADETGAIAAREKQSAQLRERAKRLLIQKRFQRAVEVCNEALILTPGSYKVLRIRSAAWCELGEFEKGLADADLVLKDVPYSSDSWYQKGYSHFHLKDYAAAAHAFAQGLERNSSDRVLQHGFTDALTLMAAVKTTRRAADAPATRGSPASGPPSVQATVAAAHAELDESVPGLPSAAGQPQQGMADSIQEGADGETDGADEETVADVEGCEGTLAGEAEQSGGGQQDDDVEHADASTPPPEQHEDAGMEAGGVSERVEESAAADGGQAGAPDGAQSGQAVEEAAAPVEGGTSAGQGADSGGAQSNGDAAAAAAVEADAVGAQEAADGGVQGEGS